MRKLVSLTFAPALVLAVLAPLGAQTAAPAPSSPGAPAAAAPNAGGQGGLPALLDTKRNVLFKRMVALNASLKSYTANFTFDVAMKSFPFLSPSLSGTLYYKKPKQAVIFDAVPALASQFKKIYPNLDPPATWPTLYDVAVMSDDGTTTLFRLQPKKNGRIEHLDVKVADDIATIGEMTWTYKDGGFVTFDQIFEKIGASELPQKLTGHVELPAYKADVVSAVTGYKLNAAVDDSVFSK